jgi:predicted nucleic acid-binding protein
VSFAVVYDACVLYPNVLRDLLIRVAIGHKVRAHWTDQILDEVFENLIENRPDLDRVRLARTRVLMGKALPDAKVTGYESLVPALELPDPDDRHVLAAAIRAGAQMIVTSNLKDFPPECLSPFAIEAKGPDDFLVDQYHLDPVVMNMQVAMITADWAAKRPDSTPGDVYEHLEAAGIIQLTALLRAAGSDEPGQE